MSSGRLTTHVLDTAHGKPAAGMTIELHRIDGANRSQIRTVTTNHDGRTSQPLLEGGDLSAGVYELVFFVGEYFGSKAFLDQVPVRFIMSDAASHYHVPLLVSPFGYSTYRGS